jgi:hypothetical protein
LDDGEGHAMVTLQTISSETSQTRLDRQLRRLATATVVMAVPPMASPSSVLAQSNELLTGVRVAVTSFVKEKGFTPVRAAQAQVDDALASIDRLMEVPQSGEPARVYIEGLGEQLLSSVTLSIAGVLGEERLMFVSGTTLSSVAAAINSISGALGVHAVQSSQNPSRLEISSAMPGIDQFVRVLQITGQEAIVFAHPIGGEGMFVWADYGCVVGAPACSHAAEMYLSTNANLNLQGYGALELTFRGNFGEQQFTFASGTNQVNIIQSINTLENYTGVHAEQSQINQQRIRLSSVLVGSESLTRTWYENYTTDLIAHTAFSPALYRDLMDRGRDALLGDADCDYSVDLSDLSIVLQAWGVCPEPRTMCPGDINQDGMTDIDDLLRVISDWGAPG